MKDTNYATNYFILFLIFILALSLRIWFYLWQPVISTDGTVYATAGKSLVTGKGYLDIGGYESLQHPPLQPILIGLIYLVTRNLELSSAILCIISSALLIFPAFLLAKILYSLRAGYIVALLTTLFPSFIIIVPCHETTPLYSFLLCCWFLSLYLAIKESKAYLYIISGIILAFCYLTRAIGLFYLLPFLFITIILNVLNKNIRWPKFLIHICLFFISFLITVSPYLYSIFRRTGAISFSPVAEYFAIRNLLMDKTLVNSMNPPAIDVNLGQVTVFNFLRTNLKLCIIRLIKNCYNFYTQEFSKEIPPLIIIFAGLGLFLKPFDNSRLKKELFLFSMFIPLLIQLFWHPDPRYIIPLGIIFLMWASLGLMSFSTWSFKIKLFRFFPFFLLLSTFLFPVVKPPSLIKEGVPFEHKQLGLWLNGRIPDGQIIVSEKPFVSFYSNSFWRRLEFGDYDKIISFARGIKAGYLVVDDRFGFIRPALQFLLDAKQDTPDLIFLKQLKYGNYRISIFKIK